MIGVLALQGGFDRHAKALKQLGVDHRLVKLPRHLNGLTGLIIPGGESTTMLKLMDASELFEPLTEFCQTGVPVLGTCAGSILLCQKVTHPDQRSLNAIPATIERNAYGSQRESFCADVDIPAWDLRQMPVFFIRAPRFLATDEGVDALCHYQGDLAGIQYRQFVAVSFHPELANHTHFHRAWMQRYNLS